MTIKKVAIQMDPIEKIDLDFDTSFLLAKEAQDRGYEIFYYNPKDLEYKNRSIFALGALKGAVWLTVRPAGLYSMSDIYSS